MSLAARWLARGLSAKAAKVAKEETAKPNSAAAHSQVSLLSQIGPIQQDDGAAEIARLLAAAELALAGVVATSNDGELLVEGDLP